MAEAPGGVVGAMRPGAIGAHHDRVDLTGEIAGRAILVGLEVEPDAPRHTPEGLRRVHVLGRGDLPLVGDAGRRQPGEDAFRPLGGIGPAVIPEHIRPELVP